MTFLTNRDNMNLLTDKGGWWIAYAHPDKGLTRSFLKEKTLMSAMAVFNSLDSTTGFKIIGDIIVDRFNIDGALTDTFVMAGRYGTPQRIGPRIPNAESRYDRNERRRYRRYARRANYGK